MPSRESLILRKACLEDTASIAGHNIATAAETEGRSLDPDTARNGVLAIFEDPSRGFYLVAEESGRIIGQCMITYEWSDWRNGTFWWIQSVYVVPAYRRRGIFTRLFSEISRLASGSHGVAGVRLDVDRETELAMKAYRAIGMHRARYVMFEKEFP